MGTNYTVDSSGNETIAGQFKSISTIRGSLATPTMTQTQINAISSPITGEQVFNTTTGSLQFYNGVSFVDVGANVEPSLTINQIGFGSPSNLLTGDTNFVWDSVNNQMSIFGDVNAGIYLPTFGGVPAVLGYYEEKFTFNTNFSGPWGASTFNNPLTFSRVGNLVTMQWPGFLGAAITTPAVMENDQPLPSRFAPEPINKLEWPVKIYYGASSTDKTDGTLTLFPHAGPNLYAIFSTTDDNVFSSGFVGIGRGSVSWIIFDMV